MSDATPSLPRNPNHAVHLKDDDDDLVYLHGFGNTFESEAIQGALPRGRNTPRLVPYNLYTEQLSGTAFTSPRCTNRRTWLYRQLPSVAGTHHLLKPYKAMPVFGSASLLQEDSDAPPRQDDFCLDPNPMRWKPWKSTTTDKTFVTGLHTFCKSGSPLTKNGLSISLYHFTTSMVDTHLYNSDGDFLIVPQQGVLRIQTELGCMVVHPREICVVPRGICFSVHFHPHGEQIEAQGYVLEVYQGHFQLPELGPIGANGLANARDFQHPTAQYDAHDTAGSKSHTILNKFGGQLFVRASPHSPYNVVAWHGNYLPFKYNLDKFCAVNSVSYDHLDPSIYTVLTVAGSEPGTALADFVIFPPRILATDSNTFRPPWFHRNTMTEFMGLIQGSYDAKVGLEPGGATLHSCMTPHGPDRITYERAVADPCETPTAFKGGLAFMFETTCMLQVSRQALECDFRDVEYAQCWAGLQNNFAKRLLKDETEGDNDTRTGREEEA